MTSPAVALRPLGVAEVLDGAVRIVRRNPRAAFGFALPVAFVQALLTAALLEATLSHGGIGTVDGLVRSLVLRGAAAVVLGGLLAPVVVADVLGRPVPAGEAWRRSRGTVGLLLLVVLGVGVGIAEALGVVALVVGGLWMWGAWAVAGPAMTVESLGPFAALGRSARLAGRRFWRAWGVRALGWLFTSILTLLITLPFGALAAFVGRVGFMQVSGDVAHPALFVTVTAVGELLSVALVAPAKAAIDGLLYLDLRMRVEGLDIVLTGRAPEPPVATAPTTASGPASGPVSAW